jgi:hypothetical protein
MIMQKKYVVENNKVVDNTQSLYEEVKYEFIEEVWHP